MPSWYVSILVALGIIHVIIKSNNRCLGVRQPRLSLLTFSYTSSSLNRYDNLQIPQTAFTRSDVRLLTHQISVYTLLPSSINCNDILDTACRAFSKVGRRYSRALKIWFTFGVVVAPMLAVSISYILCRELFNAAAWLYGVSCPAWYLAHYAFSE